MQETTVRPSDLVQIVDLIGDCQEWPRARITRGHGHGYFRGVHFLAHVAGYEVGHGPVPEGYIVHHLCGNPPCCNPDHLIAVTRKEHGSLHPPSGVAAVHAAKTACPVCGGPFSHNGRQRYCEPCLRKYKREWARAHAKGAA